MRSETLGPAWVGPPLHTDVGPSSNRLPAPLHTILAVVFETPTRESYPYA